MTEHGSNFAYWSTQKEAYPFHAKTKRGQPRPDKVDPDSYGHFVAVPMPSLDKTFWGFVTGEARDRFVTDHGAEVVK